MSALESSDPPAIAARARHAVDAETLARRALGIAMNRLWGGEAVAPLPSVPPELQRDARTVLLERVPSGPERDLALELLTPRRTDGNPNSEV